MDVPCTYGGIMYCNACLSFWTATENLRDYVVVEVVEEETNIYRTSFDSNIVEVPGRGVNMQSSANSPDNLGLRNNSIARS